MKIILLLSFLMIQSLFSNELVVFLGNDNGSKDFEQAVLEQVKKLANTQNVKLKVKRSYPKTVRFTPSIYFQNHKGRALYLGRYNNLSKLEKFIRTSKVISKNDASIELNNKFTYQFKDFNFFMNLKVTNLKGTISNDFDQMNFQMEIEKLLKDNFKLIIKKNKIVQKSGDRTFYFDLYPWRSEDGKFFFNLAIYSQFDCHNPVFKTTTPIVNSSLNEAIRVSADLFEKEFINIINNSKDGDAISGLTLSSISWDKVDLKLPDAPQSPDSSFDISKFKVPQKWIYNKKENDDKPAAVFFQFPAPLNHYQGQILSSKATLTLNKENKFKDVMATGLVETSSLDMGEGLLNKSAMKEVMAKAFPSSSLKIKNLRFINPQEKLSFSHISTIIGDADFEMKGKSVSFQVKGEAGLVIGTNGRPKLFINIKYRSNISDSFEISGPDRTTESNNYMDFNIIMEMDPVDK